VIDMSMSWNILYAIDLLLLLLFLVAYYRNCYRYGYRIDFWNFQVLLLCVIPAMAMLPFERDDLNAIIVGRDLPRIIEAMPRVFLITSTGFLALYLGGNLWRLQLGIGMRRSTQKVLKVFPRTSLMIMSSRSVLIGLSTICLCLQAIMLSLYFSTAGFGFDLRAYTFLNPGIRPFVLITSSMTVVVASHCFARYVDTKERILLVCTLLAATGLLFFGQRTNIALIFINVGLCYIIKLKNKVSILRIVLMVAVAITAGFYLSSLRDGQYSLGLFFAGLGFMAFYGNTFCDMRDFAWIYSNWDHHLWLGRTYMAGVAMFVPRSASGFREKWVLGVATNSTVGIDNELHPGLKPGLFGESFFNFGWAGSIATGIIFGLILRRVDLDVKSAFEESSEQMQKAFSATSLLLLAGCFNTSLGIGGVYAFAAVGALAWLGLQIRALVSPQAGSPGLGSFQNLG
jgi:oligosaccharide repeat unit polymerase